MMKKIAFVLSLLCLLGIVVSALSVSALSPNDYGYIRKSSDGHYIQKYQVAGVNCNRTVYVDHSDVGEVGVFKVFADRDFAVEVNGNTCSSYTTYFHVVTAGSDVLYPWTYDASVNVTGANTAEYFRDQPGSTRWLSMGSYCSSRMTGSYTNNGYWSPDTY